METHCGVDDCSPGREQGSVRWQILSSWWDEGYLGGCNICRTSNILTYACAHLPTASEGKQPGAWQCHSKGKYSSVVSRILLISLSLPRTSEPPDCCAMHAADCEIGNFMSHYLPEFIESETVVKTWKYLSVIHWLHEATVSFLTTCESFQRLSHSSSTTQEKQHKGCLMKFPRLTSSPTVVILCLGKKRCAIQPCPPATETHSSQTPERHLVGYVVLCFFVVVFCLFSVICVFFLLSFVSLVLFCVSLLLCLFVEKQFRDVLWSMCFFVVFSHILEMKQNSETKTTQIRYNMMNGLHDWVSLLMRWRVREQRSDLCRTN